MLHRIDGSEVIAVPLTSAPDEDHYERATRRIGSPSVRPSWASHCS